MKTIYLIRHAQSQSNAHANSTNKIIYRNHQIALSDLGHQQACHLADMLIKQIPTPTQVFVSSYIRTHQTAKPYLDKLGMSAQILDNLHQFDYLDFEHITGKGFDELYQMSEVFWQRPNDYKDSPNCESYDDSVARVQSIRAYFKTLPDGTYVVFTHGMWISMLIWQLLNPSLIHQKVTFRQFEQTIRPNNTDMYRLTLWNAQESIAKVV